jgi:hypothetical protein
VKPPVFVLFVVLAMGCTETSVWTPFDDIPSPHNNIEHIVEVSQNGLLKVDGSTMTTADARTFFEVASRSEIMAYVYLKSEKGASPAAVAIARSLIEDSGMCRKNLCVDGYVEDALPE